MHEERESPPRFCRPSAIARWKSGALDLNRSDPKASGPAGKYCMVQRGPVLTGIPRMRNVRRRQNNIAYRLDASTDWRRNKAAIIWEGEPGDQRTLTYQQLHTEVCRFANVLKGLEVKTGDRVALYMPLIPELAIAMLACARIGATHSVIFGGFSSSALIDRINDASARSS